MRLIDAYEAKAVIKDLQKNIEREMPGATLGTVMGLISCYIDAQPTVDAEPVRHGYWRGEADGYVDGELMYDTWYCSECDYCIDDGIDDVELLPNYCPDCGAKMGGGLDDEKDKD